MIRSRKAAPVCRPDRFVMSPHVTAHYREDGVTVFHAVRGHYWHGNSTTRDVLAALERGVCVGDTVEMIAARFHVDSDVVFYDVAAVLQELVSLKVLHRGAAA